ncbi:MAG TPA: response regulator [Syntrophales bacterium]|nr:response regulator [Syntrophales bacterium]
MRLLVVDDSPEIVEILSSVMEIIGHEVTKAYDGTEAVKQLLNNRYDIVITDAKMPIMDGIELCKFIKSQFPDIYIIGISGYLDALKEFKEAGADICLSKPFTFEEIEEAVKLRFNTSPTAFGSIALQIIV